MPAYSRAHVIKYLTFVVEGTDYSNQVTSATTNPDQNVQTLKTGVPDGSVTDQDTATYTLALEGVNDNATGSLGKALRDAAASNSDLDCTLQTAPGSGQDVESFTIRPGAMPFGGGVGNFHTFSITIPIIGVPTIAQSS
jgi:hypothetical protein